MKINSILTLSVLSAIYSVEVMAGDYPTIYVEGTEISDVSGEEVKSADLAEALNKKVPNVSLIRRSGIANDIILRGQSKDNINILLDDAKIYGACPNRMDPPTSHVLTNNIESIDVIEGPYDVENFGTLTGAVKVTTKKPEKKLQGEISANMGSWDYQKYAASFSGGNDLIRGLVSLSTEKSDQYKDGNGNSFSEQVSNYTNTPVQYKNQHNDMQAYEKKTFMGKVYLNVMEDHEMVVSYTDNQSDNILYPSSKMDALYDDSSILNIDYSIKNSGSYSKDLVFKYYHSEVDHPMSTYFRNSSGTNAVNEVISKLSTDMEGVKVKNSLDLGSTLSATIGVDMSMRNWDGSYTGYGAKQGITGRKSIDNVDTKNTAIFSEIEKRYANATVNVGLRYDYTTIEQNSNQNKNKYDGLNGFINGTFQFSGLTKVFAGLGLSSRVPDARELYFKTSTGATLGTPNLKKTTNTELDIGVEHNFTNLTLKTKLFHSWLSDYIYFNSTKAMNKFENIDAKVYGLDITGIFSFTDTFYLDFGLAYQRGTKDNALAGQTDTDLANMTPLKFNLGFNFDYSDDGTVSMQVVGADTWDNYDSDNGEQKINGYSVLNLKLTHDVTENIEVTAGIDNVLDETYSVNNTYKDLTLLVDPGSDVMLINEPGRYFYLNLAYKL